MAGTKTTYCVHCGEHLAADGTLRCGACDRLAGTPGWALPVLSGVCGLLNGGWALLQDASAVAALASAVATGALVLASTRVFIDPTTFVPGRKLSGRSTVALVALVEALCISGYWAVRGDATIDVSATGVALVAFVLMPALIVPPILVGMRRGWGWMTSRPTCHRCTTFVSGRPFCGHCGAAQMSPH